MASHPVTPPLGPVRHVEVAGADLTFFDRFETALNESQHHVKTQSWRRRDAPLDPLLFAAAAASGPHVTRHHYHHDFFPTDLEGDGLDWLEDKEIHDPPPRYVSRQAPRSQRLGENKLVRPKGLPPNTTEPEKQHTTITFTPPPFDPTNPRVQVQCLSRARIPTPHGQVFLHLYRNNRDNKEHLAVVVDPAQLDTTTPQLAPPIRSRTLDATWSPLESETDRIVRGAYLGRLTPTMHTAVANLGTSPNLPLGISVPAPLVRIHSECFTGETIGSMRCDCGEQLDEALRLISLPLAIPGTENVTIPGRGVVVYMRQEGRGIGLLSKLRAYNLQDMGHDTVTANLMLGHGADERGYEIAAAILHDLGLEEIRLLTNNPDKIQSLQNEGHRITERVGMVPRTWQCRQHDHSDVAGAPELRATGVTLIGSGAAHGEELEKYLRTKVDRMGHMLNIPGALPSST